LVLKYAQVFKDDDDNDNDSDDVEDVSVHGPWITRCRFRQQALPSAQRETGERGAGALAEYRPIAGTLVWAADLNRFGDGRLPYLESMRPSSGSIG
jgi:hypothetical protein